MDSEGLHEQHVPAPFASVTPYTREKCCLLNCPQHLVETNGIEKDRERVIARVLRSCHHSSSPPEFKMSIEVASGDEDRQPKPQHSQKNKGSNSLGGS